MIANSTTRRNFLRTSAFAAASAIAIPSLSGFAEEAKKKIPIALELYSVRAELPKDFAGVLKQIGEMGYQGVEFASLQERTQKDPKALRKLLDDCGLKCCGTHTPLITLQGDALKVTIDLHKTLGNKFLICPSLAAKDAQGWTNLAKQFNDIAAKCKEQDMYVGYHSHAGDYKKYDGKTSWEIFFDNTNPEVIHQLDVGNTLSGGGDPIAMLKKYPGRTKSTHLKEFGGPAGAAIGEGTIDWKTLLETFETVGGTEWYIVEYESPNPMPKIKTCLDNLHKWGR
jgi:sugar phosphate isomerase/epimerase